MAVGSYGRVIVTGASGWVGRNAVDLLIREVAEDFTDRVVLSTSRARQLPTEAGVVDTIPLSGLLGLAPSSRTLIIHCGFPTQDQVEVKGEQSYVAAIVRLRDEMQRIIGRLGAVDMVYMSSGAATHVEQGASVAHRTRVYGQAKIDDEAAYETAIARSGGRLCTVRAFALSGSYMTKPETYALGSLILQAQRSGGIEVMANRPVRRSYMAIDDMLAIAIHAVHALAAGETRRFETAGEVVEVGDLARRVLVVLGHDPDAVTRPPIDASSPANDYLGDRTMVGALAESAVITPAGLDDQIVMTADWLRRAAVA